MTLPIIPAAYEQQVRIDVRSCAVAALQKEGVEVDPRWMHGELKSRDVTHVVSGGHFRYDATTNEVTFHPSVSNEK